MDYKIERRYQTFLARLKYSPSSSEGVSIFCFHDCMNLGAAFALSRKGHKCISKNHINPTAVRQFGFSEEEIEYLFSLPKVSNRRKLKCAMYSKNYRKRKGAVSRRDRRILNLEEYKAIKKLHGKGFTRDKIAKELNLSFSRVQYLLHIFKNS